MISDKSESCPQCGCPREKVSVSQSQESGKPQPQTYNNGRIGASNHAAEEQRFNDEVKHEPKKKRSCLKIFLGFFGFMILLSIIANCCTDDSSKTQPAKDGVSTVADVDSTSDASASNESAEPKSKWNYSETEDEMTGKTSYFASLESDNYVQFDFPYNNSLIYLTLNVRKSPRYGTDVYITIPEGQFMSSYNGTTISVRFDDGKVLKYNCSEPDDNSTTTLFINDAKSFIKKLKASEECRISASFFQEGSPTFTFQTAGFEWEH